MKEKVEKEKKNESFEETKVEAKESRTFTQVVQETPSLDSSPINYEQMITNQYDPPFDFSINS